MKLTKWKIAIISIILIPILIISILYIKFDRLPIYTFKGQKVYYNHAVYKTDAAFLQKYTDGKLQTDGVIGKTRDSKFLGFKTTVFKAKGYNKSEVIIIKGLMFDDVLIKEKKTGE
ncbi:hypothetical protein [Bacillus sp. FJAT-49736]|uniref:hypothetical protein n=1 Tax=Bacillus sp. FJAT-49736 TaxID=2833582 RepID=UPI001BC9A680|nr:hypothetical protein [Bacillus sp. FJAT-49736]MBS4174642.1 hypothetical protein [Bacillus sp. FJAT-49736]